MKQTICVLAAALFAFFAASQPGYAADPGQGKRLYDLHCVACHTTQAHWREGRVVRAWPELLAQVARWQQNAGQSWDIDQVQDVAAYLNQVYYKLPCPVAGCQGVKQAYDGRFAPMARATREAGSRPSASPMKRPAS